MNPKHDRFHLSLWYITISAKDEHLLQIYIEYSDKKRKGEGESVRQRYVGHFD